MKLQMNLWFLSQNTNMSKKLYKNIGDFCLSVTSNEYEEEKVCIANILLRFRQRCNYEVIIGRIIVVHRWDGRGVIQYLIIHPNPSLNHSHHKIVTTKMPPNQNCLPFLLPRPN